MKRKELKRPDAFLTLLKRWLGPLAHQGKFLGVFVGALVVVVIGLFVYFHHHEARQTQSRNQWYQIHKTWVKLEEQKQSLEKKKIKKRKQSHILEKMKNLETQKRILNKKVEVFIQRFSGTQASFQATVFLGDQAFEKKDWKEALKWYLKGRSFASDSVTQEGMHYLIGLTYEAMGKPQKSVLWFKKALEVVKEGIYRPYVLAAIGRSYRSLKRFEEAKIWYQKLIEEYPNSQLAKQALWMQP